jgi:hypothetical protein
MVYIPAGYTSTTWVHNSNSPTGDYVLSLSSNSPNRHVYWANKTESQVDICIDEKSDVDIYIDVVLYNVF